MAHSPHILVVDDDKEIRDLLSRYLRGHGFRVDVAADGQDMRRLLASARIDLVILDRVMPGKDGFTLCRELRAVSRVPIILLTLLASETDRVVGLELGADDYLAKPFNPQELLARIRAVLRRANDLPLQNDLQQAPVLRFADWTLHRGRRRLETKDGVLLALTNGEFDLLVAFAEHPRVILSREQILELVNGRSAVSFDRSVDMQVTRLRRRIEANPDAPEFIRTVRNKGYLFTPAVSGLKA